MGTVHVSAEELSALLDGELTPQEELHARQHLSACEVCSAEYAFAVRLDGELREAPALECAEVLELLSANLDAEANPGEQAAAQRHLADCADCRGAVQTWSSLSSALKALPLVAPSPRIDDAIYELTRTRQTRRTAPVRGIAARALIAITAVLAIIVTSLGGGGGPPSTAIIPSPTGERAIVASMQQIVFNSRNNTLYVLDVAGAAVDARDPSTNGLKTRIQVGGEPTALALNEVTNRVLVLDGAQKRVTEIDAVSNTVIGATTVALTGTATSIAVDPSNNSIVVTTSKSPTPGSGAGGAVAVINGSTKQVETVRDVSIAPRLVVPDQQRSRSALVSADAVTIVDGSYNVIATLPGGVSAAFSRHGDNVAVLSAVGTDSVVTFSGPNTPLPVNLAGAPRAMIALPDGGFLVLAATGPRGRVTRLGADGQVIGSVEVAVTGGDLVYDASTNRFTVASAGSVLSAEMPTQVVAAASQTVTPTQPASPSASSSPSAQPEASPPAPSTAPAVPTIGPNVLDQAKLLSTGLYSLPLPGGLQPQFVAASGQRLWILDQNNRVSAFDMTTGDLFNIGTLQLGAHVSYWVAGGGYVYGVDSVTGELNVVNTARERIEGRFATNVLSPVSAVAVGIDGRLWIGLRKAPYLFVFDARTHRMDSLDLGEIRVSALAVDAQGRLFYADDARGTVGTFDPQTSHLNEVTFGRAGATTALMVDSTSTLWVGTNAGEVYSVRGGAAKLTVSLQRPVTAFAADQNGRAWYLAQLPTGLTGYAYAPADGRQAPRSVAGPAQSLSFSAIGRAFLADPRGAFFMSIEGGR